ncbi:MULTISPECIES: undecaprenyldiphospho-muramoylpentapeptide beta-N-acetylglucosaminyltransferase [Campylobacter]|uniref:UDP-N-acetylglucosamine--N-acetylmuramyl-(pentapeptide) pyrophosphoryl-undecaprenol N-acetylglucosamine transferase n=1 Tax=Campylobacter porcelli TaxID=1660073 RepID=A0A1X9SWK1_9BACT|nr:MULTISPECIES: undecaprenyldiphospho-muramoylpentapeptide beta-N-acetylglucosaminyltransferase [unclassified Campylobacter]ARR00648.1 N-acetylglucosaminyl transferase [Campylobacter sp. RM6137]MCR8695811.1 undecaprenyldiphospho-muramoylpentapeptide beta-N-acetylglucosaminyltransferase [Campylobacter sp. RM19073]MEE3704187.1 undecaprenyldiphospho-muramoylpentapeptide beta-N-acetylglucosaminyltransferase [Campylobacter sp. CX2-8023-23]
MIAITGGGTGGHLAIAKAFANELNSRGIKTIFIGSSSGQDRMWFENSDIFDATYFLNSSGVVNKRGLGRLKSLINILSLSFKCKQIFSTHGVSLVISVGGYSAAPAAFGAIMWGKKLYIHEQNAVIGRLNLILKPFAKGFFSSYFEPKFSYPVDEKFFKTRRVRENLKTILFLGGSQGANFINSLAVNLAKDLDKNGVKIIHQCGQKEYEIICKKYEEIGVKAEVFPFSKDIELFMNRADFCISRAGASTIWELCANGLPTLFIPFPHAANNHQFHNAKFLQDQDAGMIIEQNKIDKDSLINIIYSINLKNISQKLISLIDKDGAKTIINSILK